MARKNDNYINGGLENLSQDLKKARLKETEPIQQ